MNRTTAAWWLTVVVAGLTGCPVPSDGGDSLAMPVEVDGTAVPSGWRAPSGPCQLDPEAPTRLLVTTTDFSTGALSIVDLQSGAVRPDVAVGSTDAIPFEHGGQAIIVHRHGIDRIDVFDTRDWSLAAQHALPGDSAASPNPHALAFDAIGRAFITTFAEPTLRIVDLRRSGSAAPLGTVDLGAFADDDGNPEASLIVTCGDLMFVTAQRLDAGFAPTGPDLLITVDPARDQALDLDPQTAEADALPLMGGWARQLRRDPADSSGRTLLALNTGIERIDLSTGVRTFAVGPEAMDEAGIGERLLPQAFDVTDDGGMAFIAAYDPGFGQVQLYRVALDGGQPEIPTAFADGFDSVERTLEVVADSLWYGSTRQGQPGMWRFDLGPAPHRTMPEATAGPLSTGLPPYSLVALP